MLLMWTCTWRCRCRRVGPEGRPGTLRRRPCAPGRSSSRRSAVVHRERGGIRGKKAGFASFEIAVSPEDAAAERRRRKGSAPTRTLSEAWPENNWRCHHGAAQWLHATFGRRYEAFHPKVLVTIHGAPKQVPHGDSDDDEGLRHPHMMVSVVMAFDHNVVLEAWPGE